MNNQTLLRITLVLFILSVFVLVIILAKDVLMPFAISIFFAYLLYPLVWKIERKRIPRVLAILLVMLIAVLFFGSITLILSAKLSNMDINFSALKDQFDARTDAMMESLEARLGIESATINRYLNKLSGALFPSGQGGAGKFFTATTTTIFQIGLLPVYTFLLLFYRTKAAYFILMLARRKNKKKVLHILREISTVTTKYMTGLLIVVFILAILNSAGLYIIGVPHAMLFGTFAAVLNLIPYIGTFIGGSIPILFVLFTYPDPFQTMFQVFILFLSVQFLENNLLTPNIVGNNIKINPLAIILGLLMANMVWGMGGMLIVVPILAILKIIMQNFDELKPFAFLISDKGVSTHKVSFAPRWKWLIRSRHQFKRFRIKAIRKFKRNL
ncbi:MAG: AI-2E family transporter [Prolixibacteraceae bacterium]